MKKHILIGCTLMGIFSLLTSCEKELMGYEGKDCLYFDVRRGATHILPSLWLSTSSTGFRQNVSALIIHGICVLPHCARSSDIFNMRMSEI